LNRHLIYQNPDVSSLLYIGINIHVYCCMLAIPGAAQLAINLLVEHIAPDSIATIEEFHIIKLSVDQARNFATVRRLDIDVDSYFH